MKLATHLSISANFDRFIVVPRVLEVHTHGELQATSVEVIKKRGVGEVCSMSNYSGVGSTRCSNSV